MNQDNTSDARPTRRSRKRPVLIGLAAGAVVVVGGASVALATGQFDREPDLSAVSSGPIVASAPVANGATTDGTTSSAANGATNSTADASATALNDAIAAAVAAAGGVGAESIDVDRDGYEVDVQLADGSDQSVFVGSDGTTRVSTERDSADSHPDPLLSTDAVEKVVAAVEGFAPTAVVRDLSTTNDRAFGAGHAYEVNAVQPDGVELELEIADDFTVTAEDIDRPGDDD